MANTVYKYKAFLCEQTALQVNLFCAQSDVFHKLKLIMSVVQSLKKRFTIHFPNYSAG